MDRSRLPSMLKPVQNIVLVGRTGNGKSATGNSIVGKDVFISELNAIGVTMTCKACKTVTPDGLLINVIDTPGLFDLSVSADFISKEIIKCLTMAKEGLHVVVLVLSLQSRITQEEENTLFSLQVLFGNKIFDHLIVLFTGGDVLEARHQTIDDYFRQGCPGFMKMVFNMCGGRRVVFNNKTKDERKKVEQISQFFAIFNEIQERNNGIPYREKLHREIKEAGEGIRQQQNEVEARNLGEAELTEKMMQLQISYEKRISEMENMVKNTLIETYAKHEKIILEMNENLKKAERENIDLRKEHNQEQMNQMMMQFGIGAMGMLGCSIL